LFGQHPDKTYRLKEHRRVGAKLEWLFNPAYPFKLSGKLKTTMANEVWALIFLAFAVHRPFTNHRVQGRATAGFVTRQFSDDSVQPIEKRLPFSV